MTRTSVCLSALTPTRLSSRRRENPIWTVMRPLQPEPLSMGMYGEIITISILFFTKFAMSGTRHT